MQVTLTETFKKHIVIKDSHTNLLILEININTATMYHIAVSNENTVC